MPLPWPKMPKRPAPTRSCPSCLITTGRRRRVFTPISVRLPPRPDCRLSSTTFHREPRAPLRDATIARLAELPRIIGLKDSSGDVTRPLRLRALVGPDFRLLSGDDALGLAFLAQGGDGCISVTSNVAPGLCRKMFLAWRQGPATRAQRLARPIAQLTAALFCETNPVALKYALSLFGLMSPRVRLPLVELGDQYKPGIAAILTELCDACPEATIGRISGPIPAGRRAMVG